MLAVIVANLQPPLYRWFFIKQPGRKVMKKFIIAFCYCLITNISFAATPNNYYEPIKSEYATKWLSGSDTYTTTLSTDMSAGGYSSSTYHIQQGTIPFRYAIDLWVAKEIYEHGGKFCQIQIQPATPTNDNISGYTWIDYYWKNDWECAKLCEPGYSGDKCQTFGEQVSCDNDYILKSMYSLITSDGAQYCHTKDMYVLDFENQKDGTPNTANATHIILGITRKLSHGAFVTPTKINSKCQINTMQTSQLEQPSYYQECYIASVYSNGQETLLCQEGYEKNESGTNCIKTPECKINMDNMCSGYSKSDYNETTHKLLSKSKPTNCTPTGNGLQVCLGSQTCTYYECKDGYALENGSNNHKCIECETTAKQGITQDGVCDICGKGEFFNKTEKRCKTATPISKQQMITGPNDDKKCWLETSPKKYSNCVMGIDE